LPDGLSELFLREGLDRISGDLPVGQISRGRWPLFSRTLSSLPFYKERPVHGFKPRRLFFSIAQKTAVLVPRRALRD
jgi:hypothetical protein